MRVRNFHWLTSYDIEFVEVRDLVFTKSFVFTYAPF